ncbi:MAG: ADP-ribosylglycohydrolase family protein [Bacteroidota bacterium]
MVGAIAGDIIGSRFEVIPTKSYEFELFSTLNTYTDDTVLTVAIADAILTGDSYTNKLREYGLNYPDAGYGGTFIQWIMGEIQGSYNSFGNGSAMRVSPIGFAYNNKEQVLEEAKKSAEISHSHPEGIKGAQAAALAVFLACQQIDKKTIRQEITETFEYDLDRTLDEIRPDYHFEISCQKSVPESIIAFLESTDYEDAIRKSISLGGDSDTMACITGAIAQAYYKTIPENIVKKVYSMIPESFKKIIILFEEKYL